MKSTRASARSLRPKNQPSGSKSSVNNSASKPAPSTSRQKPLDRPGTSNTRLTRSTAPKTAEKRRDQRDDEGPRRNRVISVGDKFQTKVPPLIGENSDVSECLDRETCVWAMDYSKTSEKKVKEFCVKVYELLQLNSERALYHLYKNGFDYEKAMISAIASADLKDEWTENDKYCFHGLFSTYGRDFKKIHQIMAHKSMRSIIEHYYKVKLQNNYASIVDRDSIGYDVNRKNSSDERDPDVTKPSTCQNCGVRTLLYHINNQLQCLACRKYFEEFNCNRTFKLRETPLNFKFSNEITSMVKDFKEMCESQFTGKSKCEEIKQNAINSCRLLRSEALRKDVNAGRIAQKVVNEVNLDEYKKLLTLGNASAAKSRIINVWTNNEKNVAVQALIRYGGSREAAASILGTKTPDMVNEFYTKYEQVLNEAMKTKSDTTAKRRQQADQQYTKMLNELERNVEVVDIE